MFYLVLILLLLAGGALTVLTIQNLMTPVKLMVFSWLSPDLPVGLVILFSFVLGAALLYLFSVASAWRDQRELKKLQKRVAELELRQQMGVSEPPPISLQATSPMMQMPGMFNNPPSN